MNDDFTREEGRALWRQAMDTAVPRPAGRPVSALELASWLDGRADERLTVRVETALAADPALLETALAAQAATLDGPTEASERLVVRARAMVAPAVKSARSRGGWLPQLGGWRRQAEWAVVGLCLLVAAGTGLWIGGGIGDDLMSETTMTSLFDDDGGLGGLLTTTEDL